MPRPLWGWTTPARAWFAALGAAAALGLMTSSTSPNGAPAPAPVLVVDPNTAPTAVLGALPRLGPSLVGKIVAARQATPFRSLDDLDTRVQGIGPATLAALRPYLRIERSDPAARSVHLARSP
jgi:competence protein ComEA